MANRCLFSKTDLWHGSQESLLGWKLQSCKKKGTQNITTHRPSGCWTTSCNSSSSSILSNRPSVARMIRSPSATGTRSKLACSGVSNDGCWFVECVKVLPSYVWFSVRVQIRWFCWISTHLIRAVKVVELLRRSVRDVSSLSSTSGS